MCLCTPAPFFTCLLCRKEMPVGQINSVFFWNFAFLRAIEKSGAEKRSTNKLVFYNLHRVETVCIFAVLL